MKQNGILLSLTDKEFDLIQEVGDDHVGTSLETPMKENAHVISDAEKVEKIAQHFAQIMDTLGLDLTDDSLRGTPMRVAKMYVEEVFGGLNPKARPDIKLFENKYGYNEMLVEKDVKVHSFCEHHFVPIIGKAHVAYINSGNVVGLSKLNRIVDYYAKRPQVQERLTVQIANDLKQALETEDVAVIIDAKHMCVSLRGIEDVTSTTITASYNGAFKNADKKEEFLSYVYGSKKS
ncbi:MAG: GTP cyclohydrolase I FolE [Flavobacteriales bacterium]|nr:GTP cyclohydrolase I FolE [Flavobacteriales bacterium]